MYIKATIHLHQVIDPTDKVTLYTPLDQDFFLKGVNEVMDEINAPHIESSHWQVNRIDYAVNIPTPYTQLYLDLLNKGRSKYYQDHKQYDGKSCYLKGKGCNYNIYSKENQLEKKLNNPHSNINVSQDDIINATDILRVEIQCKSGKVKAIQEKHKWKDRNILHYLQPNIAINALHEITKHFLLGDYFTADKGKPHNIYAQIDNSKRIRQSSKDQMIKIVSLLVSERSTTLDDVRKKLQAAGMDKTAFNTAIKRFNAININPVPIPTRLNKQYHVRHLDSLQYILDEYLKTTGLMEYGR